MFYPYPIKNASRMAVRPTILLTLCMAWARQRGLPGAETPSLARIAPPLYVWQKNDLKLSFILYKDFLCLDFLFSFMINTVYAGTFMESITILIWFLELPHACCLLHLRIIRVLLIWQCAFARCLPGRMLVCLWFGAAQCSWWAGCSRLFSSCMLIEKFPELW